MSALSGTPPHPKMRCTGVHNDSPQSPRARSSRHPQGARLHSRRQERGQTHQGFLDRSRAPLLARGLTITIEPPRRAALTGTAAAATQQRTLSEACHMKAHEPTVGETSEWYTPKHVFDGLHDDDAKPLVFDLDAAHPGEGTPHCCVPARRVLTRRENGLLVPWPKGDLGWINSPQSDYRRACVPWLEKFFRHGTGIFLIPTRPSADYWHETFSLMPNCCCSRTAKSNSFAPMAPSANNPALATR